MDIYSTGVQDLHWTRINISPNRYVGLPFPTLSVIVASSKAQKSHEM